MSVSVFYFIFLKLIWGFFFFVPAWQLGANPITYVHKLQVESMNWKYLKIPSDEKDISVGICAECS